MEKDEKYRLFKNEITVSKTMGKGAETESFDFKLFAKH